MEKIILKVFINSSSAEQRAMVQNLGEILKQEYEDNFHLTVYDIQQDKKEARHYGILAIPTIVRIKPQPERRFIGDVSSREEVISLIQSN
ncbi:circadian clock KaiB family protein [Calditrichota bacterium GD2]